MTFVPEALPALPWTAVQRERMLRAAMPVDQGIFIEGLSKSYGDFRALAGVDLEIAPGEVFGLLGPNGAGKTTLIRTLMGLLIASSGRAHVLGLDCFSDRVALKRQLGYLPDTPFFYDYLTGWELMRFMAEMYGLEPGSATRRAERLLAELQLADAASDYVTSYSLGMKKKMALALALLHEPSVLILDEPTTGLDPLSSRHIRQFIRSYGDAGGTVLLSTHWLEMAESVCDRVGILHRGQLVALGSPAALRAQGSPAALRAQGSPAALRAQGSASADGAPTLEEVFLQLTAPREAQEPVAS